MLLLVAPSKFDLGASEFMQSGQIHMQTLGSSSELASLATSVAGIRIRSGDAMSEKRWNRCHKSGGLVGAGR